jgi:hypothetical protein
MAVKWPDAGIVGLEGECCPSERGYDHGVSPHGIARIDDAAIPGSPGASYVEDKKVVPVKMEWMGVWCGVGDIENNRLVLAKVEHVPLGIWISGVPIGGEVERRRIKVRSECLAVDQPFEITRGIPFETKDEVLLVSIATRSDDIFRLGDFEGLILTASVLFYTLRGWYKRWIGSVIVYGSEHFGVC